MGLVMPSGLHRTYAGGSSFAFFAKGGHSPRSISSFRPRIFPTALDRENPIFCKIAEPKLGPVSKSQLLGIDGATNFPQAGRSWAREFGVMSERFATPFNLIHIIKAVYHFQSTRSRKHRGRRTISRFHSACVSLPSSSPSLSSPRLR
jgi:hypothetical protein